MFVCHRAYLREHTDGERLGQHLILKGDNDVDVGIGIDRDRIGGVRRGMQQGMC